MVVAASVESFTVPSGEERLGLVSNYLVNVLKNGTSAACTIFLKESNFDMPENPASPLIMVGPGTGVVPFIGFCQERSCSIDQETRGEAHLFFGCRDSNTDFIYKDFLTDAVA